ncbi:MAG TPA: putative sugar nucleotidyl transferase [Pirellulales bacterium]
MQIVLFEDQRVEQLAPLAAAEPVFAVTCGGYKLAQLVGNLGPECTLVRKHLAAVEAESFPQRMPPQTPLAGPVLFVNARLVPSISIFGRLKALAAAGNECVISSGGSIAAALVNRDSVDLRGCVGNPAAVDQLIQSFNLPERAVDLPLLEYPHDVLRHHLAYCREDLEYRIKSGPPQSYPTAGGQAAAPHPGYREVRDGVFVAENVTLGEYLVTDTKNGPIVIDHEATVGPFCFLRGPVYIGPCAKVNEHASLKDCVSLGHHTKVGGEVEASIIEPYSNKQHHGFLGHSYVGSWVNLGAGTSNSDLKNTYGAVSMEYRSGDRSGRDAAARKVFTGLQFLGCFIGDYAKTAINTSIFTGKTIGACSMVYGFVTTNVPAFANYARSFGPAATGTSGDVRSTGFGIPHKSADPRGAAAGQITDLPAEVMISIQKRMFARRKVTQRQCDIQLIRDLHQMARQHERLPSEPLTF